MAEPRGDKTQRDIRQRVKINGEDIGVHCAAWAQGAMSNELLLEKLQKNADEIKADLAAFETAEP